MKTCILRGKWLVIITSLINILGMDLSALDSVRLFRFSDRYLVSMVSFVLPDLTSILLEWSVVFHCGVFGVNIRYIL